MPIDTGWHLYLSYKSGTKHVVQWLADAVRQRCNVAAFMPALCGSQHTKAQESVALSTSDLLTLGRQLLAESSSTLPPPAGIGDTMIVLRGVISGRRECNVWRQQRNVDGKSSSASDSHLHFVNVLESLRMILHRVQAVSSVPERMDVHETVSNMTYEPSNVFCALQVEQPKKSKALKSMQTKKTRCNSAKSNSLFTQPKVELDSHEDDKDFALWCTLKECYEVRCYIKKMVVYTASRTNANAFAQEFPELAGFDEIAQHLDIQLDISEDGVKEFSCKGAMSKATGDVISSFDLLCMPAFTLLLLIRNAHNSPDESEQQYDTISHINACHALGTDILYCERELKALFKDPERQQFAFAGCDVLTQLLMPFVSFPTVLPIQLVFALQMQMDIYDALDGLAILESVELTWQIPYLTMSLWMLTQTAVRAMLPLGVDTSVSTRQARMLHMIDKGVGTPLVPGLSLPTTLRRDIITGLACESGDLSFWLIHSPTFAGHMSAALQELAHRDGIDTCSQGLLVHSMAHLYKACQKISPGLEWPDMDWVIARQGKRAFGLLESVEPATAASLQTCAKFYGLSLGVDYAKYAKQRRRGKNGVCDRLRLPPYASCVARAERLKVHSIYMSAHDQCVQTAGNLNLSPHMMLKAACHQTAHKFLAESNPTSKKPTTSHMSTVEALSLLKASLITEQTDMLFDFHQFFACCSLVMYKVYAACVYNRRFRAKVKPGMMFYEIIDEVLWDAATGGHTFFANITEQLRLGIGEFGGLQSKQVPLFTKMAEERNVVRERFVAERCGKRVEDVHTGRLRLEIRGGEIEVVRLQTFAVGSFAECESEAVLLLL